MIPKHVSGKSRRRAEVRQRTKKRFFKGGWMVIGELRTIDLAVLERIAQPVGDSNV